MNPVANGDGTLTLTTCGIHEMLKPGHRIWLGSNQRAAFREAMAEVVRIEGSRVTVRVFD